MAASAPSPTSARDAWCQLGPSPRGRGDARADRDGEGRRLIYTGLTEAFFTYLQVAFFAGIFLTFPVIEGENFEPFARLLAPEPERGWLHCGPSGAGHFAKMIHNGIEYGMMQAFAEGFSIMRHKEELGLDLAGFNGPILAPGVGAQGAGRGELESTFAGTSGVVLPNSSREILSAGPAVAALRAAVAATQRSLGLAGDAGPGMD